MRLSRKAVLEARAALREAVRRFFAVRGYLEVETPIAVPCPGTEVHLRYFRTAWRDFRGHEHELWLRSSPELHMKRLLSVECPRIFQLGPCFRNGGERSAWHQPEFTMLEWYASGVSFEDFIAETEDLLRETAAATRQTLARLGAKPRIDLDVRLPRVTVSEAFERYAGLSLQDGDQDLGRKAEAKGIGSVSAQDDFETAFFKILLEKIEPALLASGGAVLLDYPPSQAALATVRDGVAKRFEIYLDRVELCNGFEEELDASENHRRYVEAMTTRRSLGFETPPEDRDFLAALERGVPPACGNALGFDRWLGILLGSESLDEALPFRTDPPYSHGDPR